MRKFAPVYGVHYENMIVENAIENFAFENLKSLEKTDRWRTKPYHLAFPLLTHPTPHRDCSLRLLHWRIAGLFPRRTDYLILWKIDSLLAKTLSLALTVSSWSSSVLPPLSSFSHCEPLLTDLL